MVPCDATLHSQVDLCHSSKRASRPELLVIKAARIEAKADIEVTDDAGRGGQQRDEVRGARLLLSLQDEDCAGHLGALHLGSLDGEQAREGSVAVIRRASAVEPSVFDHRLRW